MSHHEGTSPSEESARVERLAFDGAVERFRAARSEVQQRIWIQNAVIAIVWLGAVAAGLACYFLPRDVLVLSLAFDGLVLIAVVIWMHSDIRTMQLAAYLRTELEPLLAQGGLGWEAFEQRVRPVSPLGTLSRVSSRGVLLATPLAIAMVAASQGVAADPGIQALFAAAVTSGISFWLTIAPRLVTRRDA